MKIPRRRAVVLGVLGLTLGAALVVHFNKPRPLTKPAFQTAKPVKPTQDSAPDLDPLQIQALQVRIYSASTLSVTQNLGDQGGYTQTISSFISDGLTEYALVSTPGGTKPSGGWPVVILAHGYINPVTYQTAGADYATLTAELARAGYMVVKPDYRGHGKSQGQPDGGHLSPVYAYDVLNLIATLKNAPTINHSRIGLIGHSLGGHVALRTIVVSRDVKATVFISGVVGSMEDLFYNWPNSPMPSDQPATLVQGIKSALISKYGDPHQNPVFWNSASAINYVSTVTGAVQINHSIGDTTVPITFSQHLNAALQSQHKSVDFYTYPGDDHQFSQNHAVLIQRIIAFYAAHL